MAAHTGPCSVLALMSKTAWALFTFANLYVWPVPRLFRVKYHSQCDFFQQAVPELTVDLL